VIAEQDCFEQTHWSIGSCDRCGRFDVIRYGNLVRKTSFCGFFVDEGVKIGKSARCDWCQNAAAPSPASKVPKADWSYRDGIMSLFEKCGAGKFVTPPLFDSEESIRGLLNLVKKRSSLNSVSVRIGIVIGAILGAAFLLTIGQYYILFPEQSTTQQSVLLSIFGLVVGGIIGAIVEAFLRMPQVAERMVRQMYYKYHPDSQLLEDVAASYPGRIRHAVRKALLEETPL